MRNKVLFLTLPLFLSGCLVQIGPSVEECTTVNNSQITTGETGTRPVSLTMQNNGGMTVGYTNFGEVVPHSSCTAAKVEAVKGTNGVKYSWYLFGNLASYEGIETISFFSDVNGNILSTATRKQLDNEWQIQTVENGMVTQQTYLNQRGGWDIIASNNYSGNGEKSVVIQNANIVKTLKWDPSIDRYNCTWNVNGQIYEDLGCYNEATNDQDYMNQDFSATPYIMNLNGATVTYQNANNQQFLKEDIARYFQ